jgi:hypothetical protein
MPLIRAAAAAPSTSSAPSITPHEQQLIDAGVNYLFPLDQGFVSPANLRQIGVTASPTIAWNYSTNDWLIKTANVRDGVGTSWHRLFTSSDGGGSSKSVPTFNNPVEMTSFSFGFTFFVHPNEIGWTDFTDFTSGGWNNSYVAMCKVGGVEYSLDRNNGNWVHWSGSSEHWSRNIGVESRQVAYRMATSCTRNGEFTCYLNGTRARQFTWNYDGQPSSHKGNGVEFGVFATPSQGKWMAMRDFWLMNRVLTTTELRQFSA